MFSAALSSSPRTLPLNPLRMPDRAARASQPGFASRRLITALIAIFVKSTAPLAVGKQPEFTAALIVVPQRCPRLTKMGQKHTHTHRVLMMLEGNRIVEQSSFCVLPRRTRGKHHPKDEKDGQSETTPTSVPCWKICPLDGGCFFILHLTVINYEYSSLMYFGSYIVGETFIHLFFLVIHLLCSLGFRDHAKSNFLRCTSFLRWQ
jgi:hypothetical protein